MQACTMKMRAPYTICQGMETCYENSRTNEKIRLGIIGTKAGHIQRSMEQNETTNEKKVLNDL